jgi:hypothetical protein
MNNQGVYLRYQHVTSAFPLKTPYRFLDYDLQFSKHLYIYLILIPFRHMKFDILILALKSSINIARPKKI